VSAFYDHEDGRGGYTTVAGRRERRVRPRPGTWTTKDGQVLQIRDMTDGHMGNTLRFLESSREKWSAATRAIFQELSSEANRRGLAWVVGSDEYCAFELEDLDGKRGACGAKAVMLMPPKFVMRGGIPPMEEQVGAQEPRCEAHRQDRLSFTGRTCDACGAVGPEFAYLCVDTGSLYCTECALAPGGPLSALLCWLVFVFTLGCVRVGRLVR
jgi:hypothetical protein